MAEVKQDILDLLEDAEDLFIRSRLKEQAALLAAKKYFGLRGLAKLVGEHPSNLCNAFNGRRKHSPTLISRLRKALEKQRKVDG